MRLILVIALGAVALTACAPSPTTPPVPTPSSSVGANAAWQAECLQATVRALELERDKIQGWLKDAPADKEKSYRQALEYIDEALAKYRRLSPDEFRIANTFHYIPGIVVGAYGRGEPGDPKPITLSDAWIAPNGHLPGLLNYAGESRSGPFYTVVGVRGGDLNAIKAGVHYRMVIQPLMPAVYPFPSFYVCVKEYEEVGGK